MTVLPLFLVLPLLVAVAIFDLRFLRIPNALPLIAVALFALLAIISPPVDLTVRIAIACLTFCLGFCAFSLRLVGGGDVKMLAALALFIPADSILLFANIFAAALLLAIPMLHIARCGFSRLRDNWAALSGARRLPVGLPMAITGFVHSAVLFNIGS